MENEKSKSWEVYSYFSITVVPEVYHINAPTEEKALEIYREKMEGPDAWEVRHIEGAIGEETYHHTEVKEIVEEENNDTTE
jgi:hypothetical protein